MQIVQITIVLCYLIISWLLIYWFDHCDNIFLILNMRKKVITHVRQSNMLCKMNIIQNVLISAKTNILSVLKMTHFFSATFQRLFHICRRNGTDQLIDWLTPMSTLAAHASIQCRIVDIIYLYVQYWTTYL